MITDCVPSKTLIATAELMTDLAGAPELGVNFEDAEGDAADRSSVDLGRVNRRVKQLAADQSADIGRRLEREGVRVAGRRGRLDGPARSASTSPTGGPRRSTPTPCCSRPGPHPGRCRARSRTASGS